MTTSTQPDVSKLFAEFGVRIGAVVIDLIFLMFLVSGVYTSLFEPTGLFILVVLLLYFPLFWWSPMRATPAQFLLGMRVVDKSGEKLSLRQALVRSVLLIGIIVALLSAFEVPDNQYYGIATFLGCVMLFLAALTPNRQAAHDLAVGSIVVNRKALRSPECLEQLLGHVSGNHSDSVKMRRPSIISMIGNLFVLVIPGLISLIVVPVSNDKNMRARINYALLETSQLKLAVEVYHKEFDEWPTINSDLGAVVRAEYPDGGYFKLEENGTIHIRFTVKPQLMRGSIILSPKASEEGIEWRCHMDGDIQSGHLPAHCRDK